MTDTPSAAQAAPTASARPRPRRLPLLLFATALLVIAIDIATKVAVVAIIPERGPIPVIGDWLVITYGRNSGAAFGIGTGLTVVFTAVAVGVVVMITRVARTLGSVGWAVALGLLLGGATGNLIDRILRAPGPGRGAVIDWIQVPNFPIFNIADSAICIGGALAVFLTFRGIDPDGSRVGDHAPEAETEPTGGAIEAELTAEDTSPSDDTTTAAAVADPADTSPGGGVPDVPDPGSADRGSLGTGSADTHPRTGETA